MKHHHGKPARPARRRGRQKIECHVLYKDNAFNAFWARCLECWRGGMEFDALIPQDRINPKDRELIRPGTVFYARSRNGKMVYRFPKVQRGN